MKIKKGKEKKTRPKEQKTDCTILKCFIKQGIMLFEAKHEATKGKGLKILTPKEILQRLTIALAQLEAGNNSENLLNEIRKIVYSLYQLLKT